MMKKIALLAVLALVLSASAASAQYTGAWNYEWDFETGTDGWTLYNGSDAGTGAGAYQGEAAWIDPADTDGPDLPDGAASGAGGGNLYLPDGSYARLDVSSLGLGADGGAFSGKKGFILQADVYIPNLLPITLTYGYPGNMNHMAGIGAEGSNVAIYCEGNIDRGGIQARDFGWDNTDRRRSWSMKSTNSDKSTWWDQWITLQIDYGYTTAGKWTAYAYIPWDNYASTAGWVVMSDGNYDVHPDGSSVDFIQLGGMYSWTQAQFDNVKLAAVPEPGSIVALASGLVGLAGFGIRRRK